MRGAVMSFQPCAKGRSMKKWCQEVEEDVRGSFSIKNP
jgi:hypothetical protein